MLMTIDSVLFCFILEFTTLELLPLNLNLALNIFVLALIVLPYNPIEVKPLAVNL